MAVLYNACFFECSEGPVFVDSFYCSSSEGEADMFFEFRNVDFL